MKLYFLNSSVCTGEQEQVSATEANNYVNDVLKKQIIELLFSFTVTGHTGKFTTTR